jgi:phage shock protein E
VELHGGWSAWRTSGGATWSSEPLAEVESDAPETPAGRFGDHAITVQQLERWFFALIDVRTPEAYDEGHIMGAINLPYESLVESLDALPRDAQLVVYDEDGTLSDQAMKRMVEEGFPRAQSLIGGIGLWREVLGTTMLWPVQ